jgi:glycosyltransferase involved in cell wall biosynthesis
LEIDKNNGYSCLILRRKGGMKNGKNKNVHILIVGPLNFPRPGAPTSRVTAYAKGMIKAGADVEILCVRPVGDTKIPSQGTAEGIGYAYSAGVTVYQKSKIRQFYYELKALIAAIRMIVEYHREKKVDAILFYAAHIYHEVIFSILARLLKITVMRDICEYPFYYDRTHNLKLRIKGYLYERLVFRLFDGLIIMTRALEDYCRPFLRKDARYLMVPIMVDWARFENVEPVTVEGRYIAYCGDPSGTKDGVDILIEAFCKIASRHTDVKLYIIGDTANRRAPDFLKKLQKEIDNRYGHGRIVLTGRVEYADVAKYLCGACALVLSRPRSVQARYGFPTKLGEYLATGNPVVVTDVGEISDYVQDGDNGFMTEPGDASAFASKLDYVLSNTEHARQVGLKGQALAREKFDYRCHGARLIEFVKQFQKN